MDKDQAHAYWKNPDKYNPVVRYFGSVNAGKRSEYLVGLAKKYIDPDDDIFELGCNVGRNLAYLINSGYENVSGIEINPKAHEIATSVLERDIFLGSLEAKVSDLPGFDVLFSMATMMHIHPALISVIQELVKKARKFIITIEDETTDRNRSYAKDYPSIMQDCDFEIIHSCHEIPGLNGRYVARVFERLT